MNFAQSLMQGMASVLSMNGRNLDYIYRFNKRSDFLLADNKMLTKEILTKAGIPVPVSYLTVSSFYEASKVVGQLSQLESFVIKPACSSGGNGILVVTEKDGNIWRTASGKKLQIEDIKHHIGNIVFGSFSLEKSDTAIVEERLISPDWLGQDGFSGLPDLRVITFKDQPICAMYRIPTLKSGGRANLHQGAVAVGIDMNNGITTHAIFNNAYITHHPDNNMPLIGLAIPEWNELKLLAANAAAQFPLKYLGIDIAITTKGPVILEVNARPGLAIQLANAKGIKETLEKLR